MCTCERGTTPNRTQCIRQTAYTDKTPHELPRANKMTELLSGSSRGDVDFITSTSNVTMSWQGVFRDFHAGIARYVASISKNLGGRYIAEVQLTSSVTQTSVYGLKLDTSDMYFSTVVAVNETGLSRSAYSDGFKVIKVHVFQQPRPYVNERFPALDWTCVPSHVEFGIHDQNMLIRHLILGTSTIKSYTKSVPRDATLFFTQNRVDDILKSQLTDISNFPPYVWPYPTASYVMYLRKI